MYRVLTFNHTRHDRLTSFHFAFDVARDPPAIEITVVSLYLL